MFLAFLIGPVFQIVGIGTQISEALAGLERTREVLHERPEDEDPRRNVTIGRINGEVVFDGVDFAYDAGKQVLFDISFRSAPDTVTALVGPSGSGKSTIIGLIAAFYTPGKGSIYVDGVDLSTVRLDSCTALLARRGPCRILFLFDGTIRENVALLASKRDRRADSRSLPYRARGRIRRIVRERLRHYRRRARREAFGRATAAGIDRARHPGGPSAILILDEATSSLDSESEALIQEGLGYLMRGRTTFVIAHRLSTIRRADQILVVEGGRIVERGRHESLYGLHGRYYDLYTRQHGVQTNLFLSPGEGEQPVEAEAASGVDSARRAGWAIRFRPQCA